MTVPYLIHDDDNRNVSHSKEVFLDPRSDTAAQEHLLLSISCFLGVGVIINKHKTSQISHCKNPSREDCETLLNLDHKCFVLDVVLIFLNLNFPLVISAPDSKQGESAASSSIKCPVKITKKNPKNLCFYKQNPHAPPGLLGPPAPQCLQR